MTDVGTRLSKIHSTGYWTVIIRPTKFSGKLIRSLSDCWRLVETSKVALRGWDYPHVNDRERDVGQDFIQSGIDWEEYGHVELWRFHQSGQFVHHFAASEDYHQLPWSASDGKPERYLLHVSALYTITEIYEFAARLAAKDILQPSAYVSISLGNMSGRELAGWGLDDMLPRGYSSQLDAIEVTDTFSPRTLLADSASLALDASLQVFERFAWLNAPHQVLADRQQEFLQRRLRTGG